RWDTYQNGFFGYVTVRKKGIEFTVEIGQDRVVNGVTEVYKTEIYQYRDIHLNFQQPLTGVALHVAAYDTRPPLDRARLRAIRIYRLNEEQGVPYIVETDDEV